MEQLTRVTKSKGKVTDKQFLINNLRVAKGIKKRRNALNYKGLVMACW